MAGGEAPPGLRGRGGRGGPGGGPAVRRGRGGGGAREGAGGEDAGDLLAGESLALQQRAGEGVKPLQVLLEDLPRLGRAVGDDPPDLGVEGHRRVLAVILVPRELPAEEDVLLVLAD